MSAAYVPQVGDRVRRTNWSDRLYMDVEYVGRSVVVGADPDGREMTAPCPAQAAANGSR